MIKLFSMKQQKKDGEPTNSRNTKKSAAVLRLTKGKQKWLLAVHKIFRKFQFPSFTTLTSIVQLVRVHFWLIHYYLIPDLNELNLPKTCATEFTDPDDLLNFKLIICPDEGFYKGGRFVFTFKVCPTTQLK